MVQTSYPLSDRFGRPGAAYDRDIDSIDRILEVAMRPGDLALRGTAANGGGETTKRLTAAAAADPDGIIATIASAAAPQSLSGVALDGVIGASVFFPPRNLVLVLSNHTDWDATTAVVTGFDEHGREITEDIVIPNGGNATVTGVKTFSRIVSLAIPAQTGTGGTATLGTGTKLGPITPHFALGLMEYVAAKVVAEGATTEYAAGDVLSITTKGRVWAEVEEDVSDGDQVFVRLVAAGAEVVGAFRASRDGTIAAPDACPVIGMRFHGDSRLSDDGVTKVAVVEFNFPAAA